MPNLVKSLKEKAADELFEILKKARENLSDEYDPEEEKYGDSEASDLDSLNSFDPEEDSDAASDWLKENDTPSGESNVSNGKTDNKAKENVGVSADSPPSKTNQPKSKRNPIKDMDPERLKKLKDVAGHWLSHADQVRKMSADAKKNPHLFAEGHRMAANNAAHEGFNDAYHNLISSPDFQGMSPAKQMRAEMKFKKDFKEKNPDYHKNAVEAVSQAHGMHSKAKDVHGREKQAQLAHIMSGGQSVGSGDTMSSQVAAQHVGGSKGESGYESSTIQDPSASFARNNKDFLSTLTKPQSSEENYEELESPEMKTIKHKSLNDPANKKLLNDFFTEHHPIIRSNVRRARNLAQASGIPEDKIDDSALHEAGMHGLMQAVHDYHPEVGSFRTHANGKIAGLMQNHLSSQDVVPKELRSKAKAYDKQKSVAVPTEAPKTEASPVVDTPSVEAPKKDIHQMISQSGHSDAGNMSDRLTRLRSAKKDK